MLWLAAAIGLVLLAASATASAALYHNNRALKRAFAEQREKLIRREEALHRQVYELAILKELGDRVGYSLDVEKVVDIITGSLSQFLDYSAVASMLLEQDTVVFKVHLEESVDRGFVDTMRERMLRSLSTLLDRKLPSQRVEETLSGAILQNERDLPVRSYFNIPIVIGERVVGVLTVAHTKAGLYHEEDMTILYKIVKQASQALARLEEVVRNEESKFNAMVESMADGIIMTDLDYRLVVVNPAAKRIAGLDEREEVSIFDFIDQFGGVFDIHGKIEEAVKLDKVLIEHEVVIDERFFDVIVSPVKSSDGLGEGEVVGGVAIFHDMTNEKRAEKMREEFTSVIVHELRSPLDAIQKMAESMAEGGRQVHKGRESYLQLIEHHAKRMLDLVNDLLDVAKLESGKFTIDRNRERIANVLSESVEMFHASAQSQNIAITTKHDPELPQTACLDMPRIIQVLTNFISNALKFTDSGGEILVGAVYHRAGADVRDELARAGLLKAFPERAPALGDDRDSLLFLVADNGIGMSEDVKSQLFNKFLQVKRSARDRHHIQSTGLGLVIAKGIVEAHDGFIGFFSEEGRGSTFYFTVPLEIPRGE